MGANDPVETKTTNFWESFLSPLWSPCLWNFLRFDFSFSVGCLICVPLTPTKHAIRPEKLSGTTAILFLFSFQWHLLMRSFFVNNKTTKTTNDNDDDNDDDDDDDNKTTATKKILRNSHMIFHTFSNTVSSSYHFSIHSRNIRKWEVLL